MTNAFAAFANKGVIREGRTFTKVYDSDGNLVLDNTQKSEQILSEKAVNYMNVCLSDAVNRGTGTEAKISGQYVYGKTGTTASERDRWFCGFTGHYTAAVWCGYLMPEDMKVVGGGNPAAQLFGKVMKLVHQGLGRIELVDDSKLGTVKVCLDSGLRATDACEADARTLAGLSRTESARVYPGEGPSKSCDKHVFVDYCTEGKAVANEYCALFAQEQGFELTQKSLLKMTKEEMDAIVKASKHGLKDVYLQNDYVYLVKDDGTDGVFKGFKNNANQDVDAPYLVCTKHTKQTWEEYLMNQPVVPDAPLPGEDPNGDFVG
jgi:membrane peptidoglycan carboxypeptidase